MKIVCESCGAKYSIADERVAGKVFKIRCKRCSEVIVVRGDVQVQPAAQPSPVYAQQQDPIWHVVVEGEQAGPYTPAQLGEMLTSGTVDWDAYVWTEGFDNWAPILSLTMRLRAIPACSAADRPRAALICSRAAPRSRPRARSVARAMSRA